MTSLEPIVTALGGTLYDGGRRALVPGPGHSPADRSVSLSLTREGRILIHCFSPGDDWRSVRDHLRARGLLKGAGPLVRSHDAAPVGRARARSVDRSARARGWWDEGEALEGTPAERYLRRRGVTRALASPALRFHPAATSLEDRFRRPALLAAITDACGRVQGVQILLVDRFGAKAAVATPRRIVGALLGGAVRLDAPVDGALLVAEGVETALSASQMLQAPAWAALSVWNLAHLRAPHPLHRLIIAADNGAPGRDGASALALSLRAERADMTVDIAPPPAPFGDWNDALQARGA